MTHEDETTPATARQLLTLRAVGVLAVACTTAAAVQWPQYPAIAAFNSVVCWYVGKLLGVPLDAVVQAALKVMAPAQAAAVLRSLPPASAESATATLLQSLTPERRIVLINTASSAPPPPADG